MADQRRRGGRGRSGRGGRIPRKGDAAPGTTQAFGETFVSFPLAVTGPIRVQATLDEAAVEGLLRDTLERERRQAAAVQALAARGADPTLRAVGAEIERHRNTLEELARDLGAEVPPRSDGAAPEGDEWDLVAQQRLSRLGWGALQRVAFASGDKRIDRAVKGVLRDKERHAQVLEEYAERQALLALFRQG